MTAQPAMASRSTPFGYACHRCSLCCRFKHIQINPYEVARLARAKGESTSQFRTAWTIDGRGTVLGQKEDGTCVFLGAQGCEVHVDRPLVCRLYPLGRHVQPDGSEYYTVLEGHPQSKGEFTARGTVADHLAAQGAKPFMDAADGYLRWLGWAGERLGWPSDAGVSETSSGSHELDLLDMDGMIEKHCATTGAAEPASLEDRLQLHMQLLYDAIANMEDADVEENSEVDETVA
jgi:Fe-S-cluster containining protein